MLKLAGLVLVAVAVFALWPRDEEPQRPRTPRAATPEPSPERERRPLRRPPCRDDVPDCASVRGRIVFVERVDPDGDGDLHVVIAHRGGVTLRGLSSIDVRPGLRPRRDPRIGDEAAAMGPVQRGSVGQSQIHALVFRVRRR